MDPELMGLAYTRFNCHRCRAQQQSAAHGFAERTLATQAPPRRRGLPERHRADTGGIGLVEGAVQTFRHRNGRE